MGQNEESWSEIVKEEKNQTLVNIALVMALTLVII